MSDIDDIVQSIRKKRGGKRTRKRGDMDPAMEESLQVDVLKELLDSYQKHMPVPQYKVGDLVTPTETANIDGHGTPMIVVEVVDARENSLCHSFMYNTQDCGSCNLGVPYNIRVLRLVGDSNLSSCWWEEAWKFIPWTPAEPKDTCTEKDKSEDLGVEVDTEAGWAGIKDKAKVVH